MNEPFQGLTLYVRDEIDYERARSARASFFNLGEKSEYERPAGRGHAFEKLISQQPRDRLTNRLLC